MHTLRKTFGIISSFFYVRHSIKAKIFISFAIIIISIAAAISAYWYHFTIESALGTLVDNMDKSMNSSMTQLDNAIGDVRKMHSTLLYETNSTNYILKEDSAPGSAWFETYNQTYSNLRIMAINLSRTVAGIGVFKLNGETCMNGILCIDHQDVLSIKGVKELKNALGDDVIFYLDKKSGETKNEVLKYIFIGRSVINNGEERAVIISRLNESVFTGVLYENLYTDGFVLLFDENNTILYDSSPGTKQTDKRNAMYLSSNLQEAEIEGDYLIFSQKSKSTPLPLVSAVPRTYLEQINQVALMQLLTIFLFSVVVIAVLSMTISNKITLNLIKLSAEMKKVGNGSAIEPNIISSADEVGDLYASFINMADEIQHLLGSIKENEKQKRIMEIKVLRAQISPHFLYNSLNTINYLALLQNAKNIHHLTSSLIDLLQAAVHIDDQLISIKDEIKYVISYINIQQYRFPYRINVEYHVDEQTASCKVPKMILQPIVENSIIHGLANSAGDGIIRIKSYSMDGKTLYFNVTDNGVGMSAEKIEQVMNQDNKNNMRFSGIGIGNVDARIKLQFGENYGVSIYSQEKVFTTVEIRLPIIYGDAE